MISLLGAEGGANIGSIIGLVILGVLLIGYIVFGFMNRKKQQEQAVKMMSELKEGDKVVTNAGIYGEIVSMKETNMGRVVVIKTGEDKPSYITINATVILGIDKKEDLVLDADGNPIDPTDEQLKKEVLEEKAAEEKPAKKTTAKKSTTKKAK